MSEDLLLATARNVLFQAVDVNGDAVTGIADGAWTNKRISKDGGAFGALTATITERERGWYLLPLTTAHTDTLGELNITFTAAACKQVNLKFNVRRHIFDEPLAGHSTVGTLGSMFTPITTGTAQSGAATALRLAAGFPTEDIVTGQMVWIASGQGAGQSNIATGYNTATGDVSFAIAWKVAPNNTSVYEVWPFGWSPLAQIELLLNASLGQGDDGSAGRTVRNALRPLRNKVDFIVESGKGIVYKEDDTTEAWRADATGVPGGAPIGRFDPL